MSCKYCGMAFKENKHGRPKLYCSIKCRRAIEKRRRQYDQGIKFFKNNADSEFLTPAQRESWAEKFRYYKNELSPRL